MNDRQLPPGAVRVGASPEFDRDNLPDKLRADHRMGVGVYGRLVVLAGALDFVRQTAGVSNRPVAERLSVGQSYIILPDEPHHVVPCEGMRFQIEFYKVREGEGASSCS